MLRNMFILTIFIIMACGPVEPGNVYALPVPEQKAEHPLAKADAESILGEIALLEDSSVSSTEKHSHLDMVYRAQDSVNGKLGRVYYMYETYADTADAARVYTEIKTANERNSGLRTLEGAGDEAYYHSDGKNFCFILARKRNHCIRMKVNKLTSKTSSENFISVAKRIVNSIK